MGLSNKFDSNIYIEPDGSRWVRIFHHNNPSSYGVFVHHSDAEWNAGVYATEHKWFDLGILDDISGTWELMVKQISTSSTAEQKWRWTQNYNPLTTTSWTTAQPGTVTINTSSGYQPSSMGGLWKMNSSSRMNIANTTSSNWFGAIGSWTVYNNGFPGYPNTTITTGYLDLYVRVDALLEPLPEKGLRIWLPLTGDLINRGLEQGIEINNTGVTFDDAGKCGQCASFNGSSSRLSLTNLSVGNEWSYGCWVYTNQTSRSWEAIAVLNNNGGDSDNQLGLYIATSTNKFQSTANGQYNSSIPFTTNKWSHLFATFDGSTLITYVDGVKVNEKAITNGLLARPNLTIGARSSSTSGGQISANLFFLGKINDFRLYNYTLSAKEVKELAKCLVLHYKLSGACGSGDNLGNTSADYHNKSDGLTENCSAWGGDAGTVTWHHSGGYNNLPYKVYHKTAPGTGGIYAFPACDITLKASTTYTMSVYVKASRDFSDSHYSFNVNRRSDNHYITNGSSVHYTTDWTRVVKTFTTSSSEAGEYCEMSIIYDDAVTDYYVYYSGFKIEEGSVATEWSPPINSSDLTVYDASGYGYNGYIQSGRDMSTTGDTARYSASTMFPFTSSQTGNYITMDNANFFSALSNCTITWWGKYKVAKSLLLTGQTTSHYLAAGNPSFYNGTCTLTKWYTDGLPQGTPSYVANQWHFYAFTGTLNSWTKLMLNNYGGGDTWSINGQISDFRIYNSTLSDAYRLELYQTSASIDKNGNYFTRELVE